MLPAALTKSYARNEASARLLLGQMARLCKGRSLSGTGRFCRWTSVMTACSRQWWCRILRATRVSCGVHTARKVRECPLRRGTGLVGVVRNLEAF